MRRLPPILFVLAVLCSAFPARSSGQTPAAKPVQFDRDIRPILSDNCFACHGPDASKRKAKLRLDTKAGALADLGGHTAIVPGKLDESELISRIESKEADEQMPPAKSGKKLTAQQIDLLKRWVATGAEYKGHWAFEHPLKKPGDIDSFVLAKLTEKGLKPSPKADRVTLIRRLTFDLTGLPPTPAEVEAYANDKASNAYEKVVDRLVSSPHYGERMAMAWLDWVRFADTAGYHSDNARDVYLYRDYVIESFNKNKPFDVFTTEQIAGDLLPNPTREQKIASGYHRILMTTEEGGAQAKEYTAKYSADRVRNASQVWLGATLGCAECHDHKFDPYTTKDFYRFAAFFADIQEVAVGAQPPTKLPTPEQQSKIDTLDSKIAAQKALLERSTDALEAAQKSWEKQALSHRDVWSVLKPDSVKSKSGSGFKIESDGIVKAEGKIAETDTSTITLSGDQKDITALRLEVFPDDSLPNKGPGRAANGNFVLNEIKVSFEGKPLPLANASATYSQPGYDVAGAIDGKGPSGWALMEHAGKPNHAVFEFTNNLNLSKGSPLTITLAMNYGSGHLIGKFRVSVTNKRRPVKAGEVDGLPSAVRDALAVESGKRSKPQHETLAAYHRSISPLLDPVRKELGDLNKQREAALAAAPSMLVASSMPMPRTVRILPRGNWLDDSGQEVTPAVPAFLGAEVKGRRATRLDLAKWLVAVENPLVARVFVNRIWKLTFGQGLVSSIEDFGAQGTSPSHPELLDNLAVTFREEGWDLKKLIKRIVMSETYQQSSKTSDALRDVDANNQWLARQNRFRLDAEFIRDDMLVVSGLLVPKVGGPSVKPYQPVGYWAHLNFPRREYMNDHGENLYRRGMYTWWQRTFPHPGLLAFDAPSREECTAQRSRSNTPLQALVLLNDPIYVEGARALGEQMIKEGGAKSETRLDAGFRRAVGRKPRPEEAKILIELTEKYKAYFASHSKETDEFLKIGERPLPINIDKVELATWASIGRAILNLHETITRN
jgi:mono/diheme cytochrome c family protein